MDDNNENMKIKEELKESIKVLEEKITNLLNSKESKLNKEIKNMNLKIKETLEKTNIIIEDYSSQKLDHQKIVELEIFKNKVDSMLITHEIRINNNIQDLAKFQAKYDEAIMNNLRVPGFIGLSC